MVCWSERERCPGLYVWMLGPSWWSCLGHARAGEALLEKMCHWGQNCSFRFPNSLLLPVCIPCLLLVVWDVSAQPFLPPCFHSAILNSNSLEQEARLHSLTRCLGNVAFITALVRKMINLASAKRRDAQGFPGWFHKLVNVIRNEMRPSLQCLSIEEAHPILSVQDFIGIECLGHVALTSLILGTQGPTREWIPCTPGPHKPQTGHFLKVYICGK